MDLFRKYLISGGLPDAVNTYIETKNVVRVRALQSEIQNYYAIDASKYDTENRLKIRKIYDMLPSVLENKKKRIVVKDIENKAGKRYGDYEEEFEYLIHSGIALEVKAISNPVFPLLESSSKNLMKLYLNDVGLLTNVLYKNNIRAIMDDAASVNLGSVYECVVASELKAHGKNLFYYDNKKRGEVDFLIDDYDTLSVLPIEVKSGKDYSTHRALNGFVLNEDYGIKNAYVLSNKREVIVENRITYLPVYYSMFF
jgi:predicted AAA+ superfamily ATPase